MVRMSVSVRGCWLTVDEAGLEVRRMHTVPYAVACGMWPHAISMRLSAVVKYLRMNCIPGYLVHMYLSRID